MFGTDNIFLSSSKGPVPIFNTVVGSMNTNETSLGLLGLHAKPNIFSVDGSNVYHNSTLQTLKDSKIIPSLSYSYNAGAYYSKFGEQMIDVVSSD